MSDYKEKYFEASLGYLDLVELVKYHSESVYEKIFKHGKPNPLKLMIDRVVTEDEYKKLDCVYMKARIEQLEKALEEALVRLSVEHDMKNGTVTPGDTGLILDLKFRESDVAFIGRVLREMLGGGKVRMTARDIYESLSQEFVRKGIASNRFSELNELYTWATIGEESKSEYGKIQTLEKAIAILGKSNKKALSNSEWWLDVLEDGFVDSESPEKHKDHKNHEELNGVLQTANREVKEILGEKEYARIMEQE